MNPTRSLLSSLLLAGLVPAQSPAVLLRDTRPGTGGSGILGWTEMQGRLYFSAQTTAFSTSYDLFATDGTPAGTVSFGLQSAGVQVSNGVPVASGSQVFFIGRTAASGGELWRTDGTVAGTRLVADLNPGSMDAFIDQITAWRGQVLFQATVPLGPNPSLWRSDGTAAGTQSVGGPWGNLVRLTVAGDKLFFLTGDITTGAELWVLDDPQGTPRMVLDIWPGYQGSGINQLIEWRGRLWFNANDGVNGNELWSSDGTAGGTQMVADINPGPGDFGPAVFTPTRNYLFFMGGPAGSGDIWRTDGTQQGTQIVPATPPLVGFAGPSAFGVAGDVVYARATTAQAPTEIDVWRMDGTPGGTQRVRGSNQSRALSPMHFGGAGSRYVYFRGDDGVSGVELWRSDGTQTGTTLVADVVPGVGGGSSPMLIRPLGGNLVFLGFTPANGGEPFAVPLDACGHAVGTGCGAPARATTMTATDPVLGQTCTLSGRHAFPGSTGVLFYGAPAAAPIPVGSGSCRWLLSPTRFFFLATVGTAANSWSMPLPIPNDPALQRVLLRAQGVFAITDAPGGFDLTNAANLNLGR